MKELIRSIAFVVSFFFGITFVSESSLGIEPITNDDSTSGTEVIDSTTFFRSKGGHDAHMIMKDW